MKKAVIQSVVLITQKQKKGTPPTDRKNCGKSVVALFIYYYKSMLCVYISIYNRKRAPPHEVPFFIYGQEYGMYIDST